MKTLIGKNLGQIHKSVNPIGCLKRASEKQCLSMRKPALVLDEEPFAISMVQPDIAVKSTISCNRFLSLYFSLLLNITRRTMNAALSFCHKREEDTFSCGLLMFSRPL